MSKGVNTNTPVDPDPGGVQGQQLSTNQQAVPVPYMAGTEKVSITWVSRVYNLKAVEAPTAAGKGGK